MRFLFTLLVLLLCLTATGLVVVAQTNNTPFPQPTELQQGPPLTNEEFVRQLYQLPAHPSEVQKLIDDIRKRGIAFPITPGLRSVAPSQSAKNASYRYTL